jgi:hypothetical protein
MFSKAQKLLALSVNLAGTQGASIVQGMLTRATLSPCKRARSHIRISCMVALAAGCALSAVAADDDHWDPQFGAPGTDGKVMDMVTRGSDLYVTGGFTSAGEAGCVGIAKWDGSRWSGLGSGFALGSGPSGYAVAMVGSDLYVGGVYITNISGVPVRGLGKWNGASWSEVGGGVNGLVFRLLAKGKDLYVGGYFSQVGSVTASNIARWDGTNWFPLGDGLSGATNGVATPNASCMAVAPNGDLIVGGNFRYAGGVEANNVARWDGSAWHALGSGVYNGGYYMAVNAVAALDTNIYVAGVFKTASGINATNLACWNGSQWSAMGGGPFGTNTSLAIIGTNLYTAGNFTNLSGVAARHVARWVGNSWQPLAPGTAGEVLTAVTCLATDGTNLYAGGDFIQAGNAGTLCIAKWDGAQWGALAGPKDQGVWFSPSAIRAVGQELYVGGSGLRIAGGIKPNRIAHWNGSAWDDMGGGVSGGSARVFAILENSGTVYVGGNFTSAGGVTAKNIAYWNGSSWNAMASGLSDEVYALCFHNGYLFAGGLFQTRGNGTGGLHGIARWDGSDWAEVPTISSWRVNNSINALASDGVNLYVGGNYFIGWFIPYPPYTETDLDNIGYWDGSNWWPLGNGLSTTVNALAFAGGELYAGGTFTLSGTASVRRLAKWTGSAWTEVGGGMTNGTVAALGAVGSTLYVGGSFSAIGGNTNYSRLATWDGSQWHTLGSGISRLIAGSPSVSQIAVSGSDVYLVGTMTYAGGRPSSYLAHWNDTMFFVPPVIRLINPGINQWGQFHFDISGLSSGGFTIQATTDFTGWSDIYWDSFPNTNFTDVDSASMPARHYRVETPWPQ